MTAADLGRYGKRFVQMFWDPELKNDDNSPVWCLGRKYENTQATRAGSVEVSTAETLGTTQEVKPARSHEVAVPGSGEGILEVKSDVAEPRQQTEIESQWPKAFLDDFESKMWFTYRSGFPAIAKSPSAAALQGMNFSTRLRSQLANVGGFSSDTGWGCMIRSGQCLLANALSILRLGRDWTRGASGSDEKALLSLFADDPRAPFSIHRFVEHGAAACGTHPGQWFGPSATAKCIEALSNTSSEAGLKVYVTGDAPDVYEDKLLNIAKAGTKHFHPTLLLVGTRLGIDRITPAYREALKAILQMPQSVGIAGGRPSSSHYFIGTQGSHLFYLDPHQTRPALPFHDRPEDYTAEEVSTCHTHRLRRLALEDMDPSMLIAFLFRDQGEWDAWRRSVSEAPGKAIFHVASSAPPEQGEWTEREGALGEVETFDDSDDEM